MMIREEMFFNCGCNSLAWRVAKEELRDRQHAEDWLKSEDKAAFKLRDNVIQKLGNPGSAVRAEGNLVWVLFGMVAAFTLILLGWHNWVALPSSHISTLLILLNVLVILLSTLVMHVGFFGRLISLYTRNFLRVQYLSHMVKVRFFPFSLKTRRAHMTHLAATRFRSWETFSWMRGGIAGMYAVLLSLSLSLHIYSYLKISSHSFFGRCCCRNFVLNEDLALDYDIGGLAVSATFLIDVTVFSVLVVQLWREGFLALLDSPGSYCAYMCLYLTMCLIR